MGLLDQAKADIEAITSNLNEWASSLTLLVPGATFDYTFDNTFANGQITLHGLHTKHHMAVEVETGKQVNSKNAHCSFSEKFLTDAGYPVRDNSGEVYLKNHRVAVKDSTGVVKEYVILQWFPDETIGLIVCILGDFEA